jgi:hypothetical protein
VFALLRRCTRKFSNAMHFAWGNQAIAEALTRSLQGISFSCRRRCSPALSGSCLTFLGCSTLRWGPGHARRRLRNHCTHSRRLHSCPLVIRSVCKTVALERMLYPFVARALSTHFGGGSLALGGLELQPSRLWSLRLGLLSAVKAQETDLTNPPECDTNLPLLWTLRWRTVAQGLHWRFATLPQWRKWAHL